ncbi:hypothetical protein [Priestia megaterium]|uniref:hypothetical protein n=1 Tax=Priestia megaterium TaxID=1404 RepID=UPI001CF0E2F5|nr:hypothetical protein [Priestia megaterium]
MRRVKQAVVNSVVGLAMLVTLLALTNLGNLSSSAEVGGEVDINSVAIGQENEEIEYISKTTENRSGFAKEAMEKAFFKLG